MKRTSLAEVWGKISPVTTLALAQFDRHAVPLGAGDVSWNSRFILLDHEIG
jgi:hypothetical protein